MTDELLPSAIWLTPQLSEFRKRQTHDEFAKYQSPTVSAATVANITPILAELAGEILLGPLGSAARGSSAVRGSAVISANGGSFAVDCGCCDAAFSMSGLK